MSDTVDLVEILANAAAEAVRVRREAILSGAGNLHGLMVEIELANDGTVLDVQGHLIWKSVIREARRVG